MIYDGMKRKPHIVVLLLTEFKLILLAFTMPISLTDVVLKQEIATLFGNLVD